MIAAMSVGLARAAMEAAIRYARERVTFGTTIGHHQAIQLMLADMAKDIEAARLLTWQCAWLIDQGEPATKESSFAKCFATDVAMRVTTDAVQIFGGYGYMKDLPLEKYMRDAKLMQIYEGTNQIQRIVIARHLLGLVER
jgi:alkylation response protein AidB-like acyl-CoA dehydrogenase